MFCPWYIAWVGTTILEHTSSGWGLYCTDVTEVFCDVTCYVVEVWQAFNLKQGCPEVTEDFVRMGSRESVGKFVLFSLLCSF